MQPCTFLNTCRGAIVLTILLVSASAVGAQTIVDARRIEFLPSAQHDAVNGSGVAVLQRYSLQVFLAGGATALQTADLGKPTPETDGLIRLDFVSLLAAPLTPGVLYETLVEAIGPGGRSASLRSNTFSFSVPCAWSISPTSQSFTASGGTGAVTVTTTAGCNWTATSGASWVTIASGAGGSGNGSVGFTAAANGTTAGRSATLTIAGRTFTVTEAAAACTFSISPASQAFPATGGNGAVAVSTPAGCNWTATSSASWVTIATGANGTGAGSVGFTAAANATTMGRSATLTIAGRTFTVTEAAAACTFAVNPGTITGVAAGSSGTIAVAAPSGCAWSSWTAATWIVLTGSGSGAGTAAFTIAANTALSPRTATLIVAGQTISVTQVAAVAPPPGEPGNLRIIR